MAVDRRRDESAPPKSDRTDLEVWLRIKGPDFLRRQAANIVLGVALLIALCFFLYSRGRNKSAEQVAVAQNAAAAYDFSLQLRSMTSTFVGTDAAAQEHQRRARDAINSADVVLNSEAATSVEKAIAQLAKADVCWTLANLPERAIATSQPVSGFVVKSPAEYINDAEGAYTEILRSYTDQKEVAASALLALAAIDESRGHFDEAGKWYDKVVADPTLRQAYRDMATGRKALLADLRKPYVLASTQPTTMSVAPTMNAAPTMNVAPTTTLSPLLRRPVERPSTLPAMVPLASPATTEAATPSAPPIFDLSPVPTPATQP